MPAFPQLATDAHTGAEVALKRVNDEPVLLRHHHSYAPRKDHRAHALQEWRVAVLLANHLSEPGAKFLSLPTECFGGNGSRGGNGSVVLLYSEQLDPFSWTQKRSSAEWWQVVREVLAGLAFMARHGVFQADMTHEQINSKGQRVTSVSNLMTTKLGVTKIIGEFAFVYLVVRLHQEVRRLTHAANRYKHAHTHANLTPQTLVRPALQMGHLAPLMPRTRVRASGCAWRTRACRVQSWVAAGCGRPTTRARWGAKKVVHMVAAAVIVERSLAL